MSEWREYSLLELTINHNSARRPIKSSERAPGSTPYYGASGIVDWVDGYTHEGEYFLVSEDGENLRSRSTPIAFQARGQIWVNNHAHVLTGRQSFDTRFLPYALAITDVAGYLTGSAQPKLSKSAMESIKLRLPSANQRRSIAEVLGALDEKIAANADAALTTARLIQALHSKAAAAGVRVRIADVASSISRGVTPRYTESEGLTVLNQKCVRDHRIDLRQARTMVRAGARQDRILKRNDVLVNSTGQGTLGRIARWTLDSIEITVDSHITLVRFDEAVVDSACAGIAMLEVESQIEALAAGSTGQTELRKDLLGAIELRLPELPVQRELGLKIREFDKLTTAWSAESERLAVTRDELLQLLMSGQIRVRDAERQAEEVL